jgi:mRNA interferase RelE/StbE
MTYKLLFTKRAKRDIDGPEAVVRARIGKKLLQLAEAEDVRTVARALVDSRIGEFRFRVGDYRVLFDLVDQTTIVILRVQHRKDVYR